MKKQVFKHWLRMSVFATLFTFSAATLSAQFFNPPAACENTYVTSPNIGFTDHTSAFSTSNANIPGYGPVDLVLAGWDHANPGWPAGFSWQFLPTANPCAPLAQGIVPYVNCRDIEVAWVDAGGDPEIVVAYYQNGVGHMVDVYSLSTGVPVLMYTNVLSGMVNYTRISIDAHIPPYAVAIIWEDAGGLKTVCGLTTGPATITWSNILAITGTAGETVPDLAFNHSGGLWLQSVSYNPGSGNFTEFQYDFWTVMGTPGFTIAPFVNDVNFVGPCNAGHGGGGNPDDPAAPPASTRRCPYPNIDAPGHGPESWAYTYTTNNADISVRLYDQPTLTFATVIVNNGTFGIVPINGSLNRYPFCYYNWAGCGPGGIVTAWHTTAIDIGTGTTAGYAGMQMTTNGVGLVSAPDYLGVAMNPTWASPTPVLSLSKQDDGLQYMYTIFPEVDLAGNFQMQHKYPPLCFNAFKGEGQENIHVACNDEEKRAAFLSSQEGTHSMSVYPNPTDASFSLSLPAAYQKEEMTLVVTNILGVVVGSYNGPAANANAYLNEFSVNLGSGTYLVDIDIKGKTKETLRVTKIQ